MDNLLNLLGEFPEKVSLNASIIEEVDCGSYIRQKVEYDVEANDRVSAYICTPKDLHDTKPAIFCHHQHAGNFVLGKSEVVGLNGNPDQAYAAELAERGFITFAPDAIAFEERNWSGDGGAEYYELSTRLVQGKTLMAKVIHDARVGIDYLLSRDEVVKDKVGFIGHSYGGRMALWLPAFDERIKVSVSNCGSIPYSKSLTREAGIQMEFCIPGIMKDFDVSDVVKSFKDTALLISATDQDKWSWGAKELYDEVKPVLGERVSLKLYEGKHVFTQPMREAAYEYLSANLQ